MAANSLLQGKSAYPWDFTTCMNTTHKNLSQLVSVTRIKCFVLYSSKNLIVLQPSDFPNFLWSLGKKKIFGHIKKRHKDLAPNPYIIPKARHPQRKWLIANCLLLHLFTSITVTAVPVADIKQCWMGCHINQSGFSIIPCNQEKYLLLNISYPIVKTIGSLQYLKTSYSDNLL